VASAELACHWGWRPAPATAAVPLPGASGRYRIQAELPGARQVFVVGSFQHWQLPGVPMTQDRPGHFAVELTLPPGRHRYQLVVDGARQPPPEADAFEPDGLGGVDGVLQVPGASDAGDGR
jgi:1,4-alpha-glucan branching enzyme